MKSLGGAKAGRVGLHVDDIERGEAGEKSENRPHQPERIGCLLLEDAINGKPGSEDVSRNVFDQLFEIRIAAFGISGQILFDKEKSEGIPHDGSPVVSD